MARIQRQQNAVVDRGRLDFEIEGLAQAFSNREAEAAIEADSEWGVDDDLGAAEAVEEALDDDGLCVGNRAERLDPTADVVGGLSGRAFRHRTFGHQPFFGPLVALDAIPNLVAQISDLGRHGRRAAARFGQPER